MGLALKFIMEFKINIEATQRVASAIYEERSLRVLDLGLIDYNDAYAIQRKTVEEVGAGQPATLILSEHPPVFTLGRIATENNFLIDQTAIKEKGAAIERIDRGGEVTFHGPGQLVVYPILDINNYGRDLKVYLGKFEQVAIDLLQHFGIVATRVDGKRGVFVGPRKIVSIGIGVRKWVSFHGLAVNVNTDLRYFDMIRPCGLDVKMTSMARELNRLQDLDAVKLKFTEIFRRQFNLQE